MLSPSSDLKVPIWTKSTTYFKKVTVPRFSVKLLHGRAQNLHNITPTNTYRTYCNMYMPAHITGELTKKSNSETAEIPPVF